MVCSLPIRRCRKQYVAMNKRKNALIAADNSQALPGTELYSVIKEIEEFIEGPYSREVFQYYQKKQPTLIRTHTGEEVSWKEAFGESYDTIPKTLKHSLVGLIEGEGQYTIKGKSTV